MALQENIFDSENSESFFALIVQLRQNRLDVLTEYQQLEHELRSEKDPLEKNHKRSELNKLAASIENIDKDITSNWQKIYTENETVKCALFLIELARLNDNKIQNLISNIETELVDSNKNLATLNADQSAWKVRTYQDFLKEIKALGSPSSFSSSDNDEIARADIPAIVSGIMHAETQGGLLSVSGNINITDTDRGDSPQFLDTVIEGKYGTLTLENGIWTYTVDPDKTAPLKEDEIDTDVIILTATDGTKQPITITITGTDDLPTIQGSSEATVAQGVLSENGHVSLYDPDADQQPTLNDDKQDGKYGTITLTNGYWTYIVDPEKIRPLNDNEAVKESFEFTASDGTTHTITLTVIGSDDDAIVTGDFDGDVTESNIKDSPAFVSGHINITDADTADTPTFNDDTVDGNYGTLVLVNGQWTYTLDREKSGKLKDQEQVKEELELKATDGTIQIIIINITGSDTDTVISGNSQSTLGQGQTSANGTVTLHDPDADTEPTMPNETVNGSFGKLTMKSDGTWTYEVFPDKIQPLDDGQQEIDTFVFTASDGSEHKIVMTVTGTEDQPVVSGVFSGSVAESDIGDAAASVSGYINITDADSNDTPTFEDSTIEGKYGSLELVDGQWTYTLDRDKSGKLKDGEKVKETIELVASDGTKQIITIDITGSNTRAVISGDTQSTLNDGQTSAEGTITLYDPDADTAPTMPDQVIDGSFGKLTMNSDGTWVYEVFPDKILPLYGGQQETDTFTFTASDGSVHEIVMTVTGTEDDPVVSGVFSGAVIESDVNDAPASVSGHINITDADTNDTPTFEDDTIEGKYGTLELLDGQWTYTLDREKSDQLKDQEKVQETIELEATDGTKQVITIDITGSNTKAVISGDTQSTLAEGQTNAQGNVTLHDPDADTDPTMPDEAIIGSFGKLTMKSDGTWTYEVFPDKIVPLDGGQKETDTFTFTASDGSQHEIIMTVTGTEDAPVVSGVFSAAVIESDINDAPASVNGHINITDADINDTPAFEDKT
ncbi:hypothetical protein CS022_04940 [Veronia nyctiphanis]|uniref:RapA2 cadherin-like domain-containing protein n=1 Tax=Veronia nyctiphanis TaxID=1278244 RepID=A0A4Q0YS18_9GAMM|nr:VCBS domain-containing protein [Veronia nyctiphanis]RXJ74000.1 hypothetical protein CS022_04940 [Veronia nyctiphanis]